MITKNKKIEPFPLLWVDPKTGIKHSAGIAFFNEEYGEFYLRIDEEPKEKKYYLKPFQVDNQRTIYRMELVLKRNDGTFKKRIKVGEGIQADETFNNIFINFGSKYKDLVLVTRS